MDGVYFIYNNNLPLPVPSTEVLAAGRLAPARETFFDGWLEIYMSDPFLPDGLSLLETFSDGCFVIHLPRSFLRGWL
jgi:hypothetical protein